MNLRFKIKTYLHRRDILYNHGKLINLWLADELGIRDIKGEIICYQMFTAKPGMLISQIVRKQQNSREVKE